MKFYLDENLPIQATESLAHLFFEHSFVSAHDRSDWIGIDDLVLFPLLSGEYFDAIITKDLNQVSDEIERRSLFENGLVWIGHKPSKQSGVLGLSLTVSTIIAAFPHVVDLWKPEPWIFRLKGVEAQSTQRLTSTRIWLDHWSK